MAIEITDEMLNAAMDAFYPGEDWRNDLGCALESSLHDMREALIAALRVQIATSSAQPYR